MEDSDDSNNADRIRSNYFLRSSRKQSTQKLEKSSTGDGEGGNDESTYHLRSRAPCLMQNLAAQVVSSSVGECSISNPPLLDISSSSEKDDESEEIVEISDDDDVICMGNDKEDVRIIDSVVQSESSSIVFPKNRMQWRKFLKQFTPSKKKTEQRLALSQSPLYPNFQKAILSTFTSPVTGKLEYQLIWPEMKWQEFLTFYGAHFGPAELFQGQRKKLRDEYVYLKTARTIQENSPKRLAPKKRIKKMKTGRAFQENFPKRLAAKTRIKKMKEFLIVDEQKLKEKVDEIEAQAITRINETKENFVVIVAGEKDVGKSSFGRILMNRFLKSGLSVYHLECDPGQTEFTPYGCLALTEVVEKVDGLPNTHSRTPYSCKYFGETSPANRTREYILCIQSLFSNFKNASSETCPSCLVINTCGWIEGTGADVLKEIVLLSNPDYAVALHQFSNLNQDGNRFQAAYHSICSMLARNGDSQRPVAQIRGPKLPNSSDLNAADLREASLLAYFGLQVKDKVDLKRAAEELFLNIRTKVPYVVRMNSVYVRFIENVPPPYFLSVLNASLVALCRFENGNNADILASKHWFDDPALPMQLKDDISTTDCFGFGMIRAIDIKAGLFYIVTSIPYERLVKVNTIIKGDTSLPPAVFKSQLINIRGNSFSSPYLVRKSTSRLDEEQLFLSTLDESNIGNDTFLKRSRNRLTSTTAKTRRKRTRLALLEGEEPATKKQKANSSGRSVKSSKTKKKKNNTGSNATNELAKPSKQKKQRKSNDALSNAINKWAKLQNHNEKANTVSVASNESAKSPECKETKSTKTTSVKREDQSSLFVSVKELNRPSVFNMSVKEEGQPSVVTVSVTTEDQKEDYRF